MGIGPIRGECRRRAGPTLRVGHSPSSRVRTKVSDGSQGTWGKRSGLNDARISEANTSGSSQAAKWPPLSTSLKYVTLG